MQNAKENLFEGVGVTPILAKKNFLNDPFPKHLCYLYALHKINILTSSLLNFSLF